jgi:putative spermidine/putrescine transport system ATP-binding protein
MTMADRVVVMSNGQVEQVGPPQDIYHRPRNAFIADFIGKTNFFSAVAEQGGARAGQVHLATPARFRAGSPVRLAIRPEQVRIDTDTAGPNRLSATVTFVRDLGPVREYHLESKLGRIILEQALAEGGTALHVGDATAVRLPPDALHVFPDPEGSGAATHSGPMAAE